MTLFIASAFLAGVTSIGGAASFAAVPEPLPRSVRATGLSVAYAIGRVALRRHNPIHHRLLDRRHGRSDLAGLICHLDQHHRGVRDLGDAREPRPDLGGLR